MKYLLRDYMKDEEQDAPLGDRLKRLAQEYFPLHRYHLFGLADAHGTSSQIRCRMCGAYIVNCSGLLKKDKGRKYP